MLAELEKLSNEELIARYQKEEDLAKKEIIKDTFFR